MKKSFYTLAFISLASLGALAANVDYHYTYVNGSYKCVNGQNQEGYNMGYLGECGQVSGNSISNASVHQMVRGLQSIGTIYDKADFSSSSLIDSDFSNSQLEFSNFNGVRFENVTLGSVHMKKSVVKGALMTQSNLKSGDFEGTSFAKSSISQTQFTGATLKGASFEGALLTQVSFEKGSLNGADFSNSSLTNISFRGADLRGALFAGAYLGEGIDWEGAIINNSTQLPFSMEMAKKKGVIQK